jgi:hypothetical protein
MSCGLQGRGDGFIPSPLTGEGGARAALAAWEGEGDSRVIAEESHPHLSSPLKGEEPAETVVDPASYPIPAP